MTEVFHDLPHAYQTNAGIVAYLKLGNYRFIPHPLQFSDHPTILRCTA
jgi:hypothetical protein